jgi:putative membrane protein
VNCNQKNTAQDFNPSHQNQFPMKNRITLFAIAIMSVMSISCGNKNDSKEIAEDQNEEKFDDRKEKDVEFAVEAADGGLLEVQLGQLALSNASSPQVKQFAQMMVDDHGKANDELKALAAGKNITLPSTLSDKAMKIYNDIAGKAGNDFDKAYMDRMVKAHKDNIDTFKEEADKGADADLKSWASAKVSTLQHHLQLAESAAETLKNSQQ